MALQSVLTLLFIVAPGVRGHPSHRFDPSLHRMRRDFALDPTMAALRHPLDPIQMPQDHFHVFEPSTPPPPPPPHVMFTSHPPVVDTFDSMWIQPTRRPRELDIYSPPAAPQTEAPESTTTDPIDEAVVMASSPAAQLTAEDIISRMELKIIEKALGSASSESDSDVDDFLSVFNRSMNYHEVHLVISQLGCPNTCLTCAESAAAECPICYERCVACVVKKCSSSCFDDICADAVADTCGKLPSCGERCKNCDCAKSP